MVKDHKNKNMTGIYYFINLVNGHCYVGCSKNISQRMSNYLNKSYLISKKNSNMPISKALFKYGPDKFSLVIIEYTESNLLYERESFWISILKPYYNVLTEGGSSINYKHSEETKLLLSKLAKDRIVSEDTKKAISEALKKELNPFYGRNHDSESLEKIINSKSLSKIFIYSSLKELLVIFPSVKTLANKIKANSTSINKAIENNTLFRGEWYIRKSLLNIEPEIPKFSYLSCDSLIEDMIKCSSIKQAIFVFDSNKKFLAKYSGIMEAEKELSIRHEKIKKYANLKLAYSGYIFSYHRLLDY